MNKLRVLVVDDNQPAAETLAIFFELEGFETETAADGEEAVEKVESGAFDLIIMDIGMPRLDGCEASKRIRALGLEKEPVLVALSGWSTEKDLERTREAGMVAHLVKPVEPDHLRSLLEDLGMRNGGGGD
ncbi:MAG: response regulator [Verrucomicrobiales bacterium]|nr:response regulator [Verrucomicrobiales bacterium]